METQQIQLFEQGDLFGQSTNPVSSVHENENVSNVTAKAPMKEQGDLFSSCVPVSVQHSDQDKDAHENVDADHVGTGRVVFELPLGLFSQGEDIDIDFKVSGLPNAVVEQAENFRVRELVKKIESDPHRLALQADLKQNNTFNPLSEKAKAMIRELGTVELFEFIIATKRLHNITLLFLNQS